MKSTFKIVVVSSALGLLSMAAVHAFSLLGPFKDWHEDEIGHQLPGDIGGPMTLSEGYRWNVPVITYAFDQSFISYFGTNGMATIDAAMAHLNSLPAMTAITNNGTNLFINGQPVPMETRFTHDEAAVLGLRDLKSHAFYHLMEELGLADPERHVWALRTRVVRGDPPITNYFVIKLNYDPITRTPSSFVNGALYTYAISDTPNPQRSDAIERADPLSFRFTSVAGGPPFPGDFVTGLTHDDVGGLKWLYETNNVVTEDLLTTVFPGRLGVSTNNNTNFVNAPWTPVFLVTNVFGTNITGTNVTTSNTLVRVALRPGVNNLNFQKVQFDSVIGSTFVPRTNVYVDVFITNGVARFQPVHRAIFTPDILFLAEDPGLDPDGDPFISERTTTASWINNDALNGNAAQGGPGVIPPPVQISFSDQFPMFLNQNPGFVDEIDAAPYGIWATYDHSTNAPIIYPQFGTVTLNDLRRLLLRGNR